MRQRVSYIGLRPRVSSIGLRPRGFTLVELMITVAVIGMLAGVVVLSSNGARASARDSKRVADLRAMALLLANFEMDILFDNSTGCGSGIVAKLCTTPVSLAQFSDPIGTSVCAQGSSAPCQYTIFGKGGSQPSTGNYFLCTYLETGYAGIRPNKGLISVGSASSTLSSGCTLITQSF
jgi:prepilin-type N-terminal cleavage/methylation domain-containing protein